MNKSFARFTRIIVPGFVDTLFMIVCTMTLATIFGFIIATILYLTDKNGLKPNKVIHTTINTLVNTIRSFPFIILVVSLMPLTRKLVGTAIGRQAALVPLTIAATCFVSRIIESSFKEVDYKLIEAVKSFGASDFQIMREVVLVESIPSIVSGLTVSVVSILGTTAAAGAVGAGGLGSVAIDYGYNSFDDTIMYGTVLVLIVLVQTIQAIGNKIYRKVRK